MKYDEKATVSIDGDGNVLKCAKGAAAGDCGFIKGADLCAKCGAMPVEMKMVPATPEEDEESVEAEDALNPTAAVAVKKKMDGKKPGHALMDMVDEEDEPEIGEDEMLTAMPKKKAATVTMGEDEAEEMVEEDEIDEDEMPEDEEDMESDEEKMMGSSGGREQRMRRMRGMKAELEDEEMMEDEEEAAAEAETGEEEEEEDEEEYAEMGTKSFSARDSEWEQIRRARIKSMGLKAADIGATGYVCAIERKAYGGSSPVCDDCPGGCVAEKGMPGILHVEGLAEKMFDGVVVDSGYSSDADMFVVDVQVKDGSVNEVFIDGESAEILGFHKLDSSSFEQKSDIGDFHLIDFTEAAEIAVKSIDGTVIAVEPDVFEGFDAYAVEIEGFDGKSYDVFVALDGEVLGYDKYEADEVEEIEAEAAEIALKRAFSEQRRFDLAKTGEAMADGSYPIVSETDLRNAIQAYGRAKDKEATKKHIMKRARALKLESMIPGNWIAGGEEKAGDLSDAEFMASLVEFQLLEDTLDDN
jgi:hypothetical protein